MSQFYWTAEDYNVGETAPEWAVWGTGTISTVKSDGTRKYIEIHGPVLSNGGAIFLPAGSAKNIEVFSEASFNRDVAIIGRVDATRTNFLRADHTHTTLRISSVEPFTSLASTTKNLTDTDINKYLVSFQEDLFKYAWGSPTGTPAFGTADSLSVTSTLNNAAGDVGILSRSADTPIRIYTFGVGTNNDPAPVKPVPTFTKVEPFHAIGTTDTTLITLPVTISDNTNNRAVIAWGSESRNPTSIQSILFNGQAGTTVYIGEVGGNKAWLTYWLDAALPAGSGTFNLTMATYGGGGDTLSGVYLENAEQSVITNYVGKTGTVNPHDSTLNLSPVVENSFTFYAGHVYATFGPLEPEPFGYWMIANEYVGSGGRYVALVTGEQNPSFGTFNKDQAVYGALNIKALTTTPPTSGSEVSLSESTTSNSLFNITTFSQLFVEESVSVDSTFGSIASVILNISDSVFASDASGDSTQATQSMEESNSVEDLNNYVAQASQALSEAILAEESWVDYIIQLVSVSESNIAQDLYSSSQIVLDKVSVEESTPALDTFLAALGAISSVNESMQIEDALVVFITLTSSVQESISTLEDFSAILQSKVSVLESISTKSDWGAITSIFGVFLQETLQTKDIYQASSFVRASFSSDLQSFDYILSTFSNEVRSLVVSSITLSAAFTSTRLGVNAGLGASKIGYKPSLNTLQIGLTPKQ